MSVYLMLTGFEMNSMLQRNKQTNAVEIYQNKSYTKYAQY